MDRMKAAKRKSFWLLCIASALLLCAPALASSTHVSNPKIRAELSPENGQFSVEPSLLTPETASSYYDGSGEAASESSVAPVKGADDLAGSIRNVNPTRGTQNCVNCAIATDATLARHAASALPGNPTSIRVLEREFGGTFRPVSGPLEIGSSLSRSGNGARGIVFGESLLPGRPGHVFNAVNQGGTIRFLDGQSGGLGVSNFDDFQNFRFLFTNPGTP
jgi:filamentous hemagglutinin